LSVSVGIEGLEIFWEEILIRSKWEPAPRFPPLQSPLPGQMKVKYILAVHPDSLKEPPTHIYAPKKISFQSKTDRKKPPEKK
jgi:hypothetical protein